MSPENGIASTAPEISETSGQSSVVRSPSSVSSLVRAGGRATDVIEFERAVVGFFVEAAHLLGVPKSVAAIYGVCFASPEPLGFSEIHERLDISAGSISQGLRVLRDVGALKVSEGSAPTTFNLQLTARPSRPRDRYEPDLELRNLVLHFIEQRLDKQLHSGRGALQSILKQVPASASGSAEVLKARVKALRTWHDKVRAVRPIVESFLKLT